MSDIILATSAFSPISSVKSKVQSKTKPALLISLLSFILTLSELPQQTTVHRRMSLSSAGRQDLDLLCTGYLLYVVRAVPFFVKVNVQVFILLQLLYVQNLDVHWYSLWSIHLESTSFPLSCWRCCVGG